MKKLLLLFVLPCLFLISCAPKMYSTQYFTYFDTVISVEGFFESKEDFERACEIIEGTLKEYDAIFDIYADGELKKLNDQKQLEVSSTLLDAIAFGIRAENVTKGYCNVAMGSVLSLWHEAREADAHYLPDDVALAEASGHTDISQLSVSGNTVTLADERMSLDMGGIAKGIVSDVLRERLAEAGFDDLYVNLGGNVMVMGNKQGKGWSIGVQDPAAENGIAHVVTVEDQCLVTSGSYQRFFEYKGKKYHHIISPDTLYPSDRYLSVTVLYENGAWADALSTALFNMSIEDGEKILDGFDNIGVMWITSENKYIYYGTLKK